MKQQTESTKFVLHTGLAPEEAAKERTTGRRSDVWQIIRHPYGKNLTPGEKLLRNSAFACMLLLSFLAIGAVDAPWAENVSGGIEAAFTTRIDLDDSLWNLAFVGNLLPESVQTFLGMDEDAFQFPADGELIHNWTEEEKWFAVACGAGGDVRAAADGTVTAVVTLSGGEEGVLIDHGSGNETVMVHLSEVFVNPGDAVSQGDVIARASETGILYFEFRQNSVSVNPESET